MGDGILDLFGNPVRIGYGRKGRPVFVPTDEDRKRIKMLLAFGWKNDRIANAVGISEPTLRKHFSSELKVRLLARDALDARRAEVLWGEAEKGNVTALKEFDKFLDRSDRREAGRDFSDAQRKARDAKSGKGSGEKLGKKEQRRRDAETAGEGTDWAQDLAPGEYPQ